jgi:hypothetical protein
VTGDINEVSLAIGQLQAGQTETHRRLDALTSAVHGYRIELNGRLGEHARRLAQLERGEQVAKGVRWALHAIWSVIAVVAGTASWLWTHRPAVLAIMLLGGGTTIA